MSRWNAARADLLAASLLLWIGFCVALPSKTHNLSLGEEEKHDKVWLGHLIVLWEKVKDILWTSDTADGEDFRQNWPELALNWRVVLGSGVGFIGAGVGSAGGVGGGGYYLTMLNVFVGFDAKTSVALSKSMVMGSAVASTLFNMREHHPQDHAAPMIDYSLALVFQPLLMLGISFGVLFNVMLPEWLVTVLFFFLTSAISFNGIRKANKLSMLERRLEESGESLGQVRARLLENGPPETSRSSDRWMIDWSKLVLLLITWSVFCAIQITKLHLRNCSPGYWALDCLQIPTALAVTFLGALKLSREETRIKGSDHELAVPTKSSALKYAIHGSYGFGGGFLAGLLGVGGGAIMGPAFLELGYPPQVASSTASFAMVFSSSLSVVEYWLLDRLPGPFGMYCVALAVVASVAGQVFIKRLVSSTGKASYIIFCLAYAILASGVVIVVVGAIRAYDTWARGGYMGFHSACSAL